MTDEELRKQLGALVRQLLEDREEEGEPVAALLLAHLGEGARELPILVEELHAWDLPNLQLGLEAALARPGWRSEIVGLSGQARHYHELGLGDLLSGARWVPGLGSPTYVNAPVGPGKSMPCLAFGLVLVHAPDGPLVLFVRRGLSGYGTPTLAVEAVTPRAGAAEAFFADLRTAMDERDVYRGQVLTVKVDPHGGGEVVFLERPELDPDELVLPAGVLDRIELHALGPSRHRDALRASGRHLARGLLLWGPPGTGKTHTVRYLTGVARDATVVLLSGGSLGMVGAFAGLARRLAPSLVVLEDVDLVAQERMYGPFGSSPVLFELMNEMDGLGDDADIAFILTTNRPDALEPALAARPGRIDLAVELPLPDDDARRRLLALYGRGLDLELKDTEAVVARTGGVTASFVKELLRRAALGAAESGRTTVTDEDLRAVLDELLAETSALTRVLLGAEAPGAGAAPAPHDWLQWAPHPGVSQITIQADPPDGG
jgi:cell division protease FtsH